MKKTGKILALSILSLIIISLFIVVVSAATPLEQLTEFFKSINLSGGGGLFSAKILLFLLVTLIVYAISAAIPFLSDTKNVWVRFGISAIIGFLSIMYLAPEEVYSILLSYETMGIVLTTFIPFVIFLVFTIQWNEKKLEYSWMISILWIAFAVVLTMKYIAGVFTWLFGTPVFGGKDIGMFGILAYGLTFIACLIMAWQGSTISMFVYRKKLAGMVQKGGIKSKRQATAEISLLEHYKTVSPELAESFDETINAIKKAHDI